MVKREDSDERAERLATTLGPAISYAVNEAILFRRLEEFFDPQLAHLWSSDTEKKQIELRVTRLLGACGGPPQAIVRRKDDRPPRYDMYLSAAFSELFATFLRARRSVARAHTFFIGMEMLRTQPEIMHMSGTEAEYLPVLRAAEDAFWEHAETAFIRLASFWDRAGQILDFVFFSIRQYERDGFQAVVDRIHVNCLPIDPRLRDSIGWRAIRHYQSSESEDGLKWLLRRRNLIVHSLHLRPLAKDSDERHLFDSEYNHLEVAARNKLAPGAPSQELERIHTHLNGAVNLFPHILALCKLRTVRPRGQRRAGG